MYLNTIAKNGTEGLNSYLSMFSMQMLRQCNISTGR